MKLTFRNIVTIHFVFSLLVFFTLSRKWASATYLETGFPNVSLDLSANQLAPTLSGLAMAALASTLGVIATRGVPRRMVGVVIAAIGFGIVFATVNLMQNLDKLIGSQLADVIGRTVTGWTTEGSFYAWLVIPSGAVIAICGILIAVKPFKTELSKRYERDSTKAQNLTPWQALDQGIDPTIEGEKRP